MKTIFTALITLMAMYSYGQTIPITTSIPRGSRTNANIDFYLKVEKTFTLPTYNDTTEASLPINIGLDSCGAKIFTRDNSEWTRHCNPKRWVRTGTGTGSDTSHSGGDFNYDTLNYYVKVVTLPPTATLTGGGIFKKVSAGADVAYTIAWGAGRQSGGINTLPTASLSTVTVNGVSQTFTNPAPGASVSGTQNVTAPRNTTTVINNVVTAVDGKSTTASISYNYSLEKFWFYSNNTTPTNSEVLASAGGNKDLVLPQTKSKSNFTITITGVNKYVHYMYPAALGVLTSIKTGGNLETIESFTRSTISVTNSGGWIEDYYDYASNITFTNTTFTFDTTQ